MVAVLLILCVRETLCNVHITLGISCWCIGQPHNNNLLPSFQYLFLLRQKGNFNGSLNLLQFFSINRFGDCMKGTYLVILNQSQGTLDPRKRTNASLPAHRMRYFRLKTTSFIFFVLFCLCVFMEKARGTCQWVALYLFFFLLGDGSVIIFFYWGTLFPIILC